MTFFTTPSISHPLLYAVYLPFLFLILRSIYRLTFHPLAKFPGTRLAAITNLWAISYDLSGSDSVVKHLGQLHSKYGPVVRVRPNELHVFDWDTYRTVFKQGTTFEKPREFYNAPPVEGSFFNVTSVAAAKPHRDLFVQAFSKASINRLEPLIHEKLELFLNRLSDVARNRKTIDLDMAFNCLTGDVTMHYCYQMSLGLIESPDFRPTLVTSLHDFAPIVPFFWYFPNLGKLMNNVVFKMLPKSIVDSAFPAAGSMLDMIQQCRELIVSLSKAPLDSEQVQHSIFSKALNPDREKGQYVASEDELTADAVAMFLAGTDTSAQALTFGLWELMKRPALLHKLRAELEVRFPAIATDSEITLPLLELEQLPYLRGVIKESLRFSMGTSARMPRVVPTGGTTIQGQYVPAGTRVSFAHYIYNNDPSIFDYPHVFDPERWIPNSSTNPQSRVDKYENHMISFSRGSRSCIGMNLAYAELYNTFAHLVSRFDFVNDGTTDHDMDWIDTFVPRRHGYLRCKVVRRVPS